MQSGRSPSAAQVTNQGRGVEEWSSPLSLPKTKSKNKGKNKEHERETKKNRGKQGKKGKDLPRGAENCFTQNVVKNRDEIELQKNLSTPVKKKDTEKTQKDESTTKLGKTRGKITKQNTQRISQVGLRRVGLRT